VINAVERYFTPDSPIELLIRFKDRLKRLISFINEVERYFTPESPIELCSRFKVRL